jgi:Protein kinase domain
MRFAPGERLGHYVIESELGAGGMGQVLRARDTSLQRSVAIKVLSSESAGPMARHRFEGEALAASALNHPHIVTVYEAGETDGDPYIVPEPSTPARYATRARLGIRHGGRSRSFWQGSRMASRARTPPASFIATLSRGTSSTESGYAKLPDFGLATLAGMMSLIANHRLRLSCKGNLASASARWPRFSGRCRLMPPNG